MTRFFITGTDTGVGKTTFSCLLLDLFAQQGLSTLGLKPVSTGCISTPNGNRHEDAGKLQAHSSLKLPYSHVNPIALIPPTSPNIASEHSISVDSILQACQPALSAQADCLIIEGVGGWKVPLNTTETMADLAVAFQLPILLVVGIRLGCINHALLTMDSIKQSGASLAGWVANEIEPSNPFKIEIQQTIAQWMEVPLLDVIQYQEKNNAFSHL